MSLTLQIALGLALALVTLFAATTFWQLQKRARYLRQAITNEPLLRQLITTRTLLDASASRYIAPLVDEKTSPKENRFPSGVLHAMRITAVNKADTSSQRIPKLAALATLLALFILGFFLGLPYLVAVVSAFLLVAPSPISNQQPATPSTTSLRWRSSSTRGTRRTRPTVSSGYRKQRASDPSTTPSKQPHSTCKRPNS